MPMKDRAGHISTSTGGERLQKAAVDRLVCIEHSVFVGYVLSRPINYLYKDDRDDGNMKREKWTCVECN